jgi:hypothetical protein
VITQLSTYKLLEKLKFIDNQLKEGLIMTHDPYSSMNVIKTETGIKGIDFEEIYAENNKILINGIYNITINLLTEFLILIENLGYLISKVYTKDKNEKITVYTLDQFETSYFYKNLDAIKDKNINLLLDPKFSTIHKLKSNILYHVTEDKFLDRIMSQGLVPRSKNTISNYPERIYFTYDIEDSKLYMKNKRGYYLMNPNKDYTIPNNPKDEKERDKMLKHDFIERKFIILQITANNFDNLIFYEDPHFPNRGIYTYDNIPNNQISIAP